MLTEIAIVVALILLNGALAMSELAIVSARPARLRPRAEAGSRGAAAALRLAETPGRFLSAVQIGITAVGVLSGAFSGATLGLRLANWLVTRGVSPDLAGSLGVALVVVAITYASLILGELVPKQVALRDPEAMAIRVAPAMVLLSRIAAPLVVALDLSGRLVLRLLGQTGAGGARVTEEEVQVILSEAQAEGVIEHEERAMLSGVMRLADRTARGLMTPRPDVEMLSLGAPADETLAAIRRSGRSRLPVTDPAGEVVGVLYVTDAFAALADGGPLDLAALMREVPVVFESTDALDVIGILRRSLNHMALVYDEYGAFLGIITTGDILASITGDFVEEIADEPALFDRGDGSCLVAGWMKADEFCDRFGLPRETAGNYDTVAGLVLNQLHRMPALGERVAVGGLTIEVVDLDGRRIDKVLVSRPPTPAPR